MYSVIVPGAVPVRRRQEAAAVLNAKSSLSREDDTLTTKFYNSKTANNSFLKPRAPISGILNGSATSNCHLSDISACLPKLILDQISETTMCQ